MIQRRKICMIGTSAVGKTSLVSRFISSMFDDKYHTTLGVKTDKKEVNIDGTDVSLLIWDLAGDDSFQQLELTYLRGTTGYLLVADGTRGPTLDQAKEIQGRVEEAIGPVPFILALNKSDLVAQWEVSDARVATLAAEGWTTIKTSAKDGTGVEEAFLTLARRMLHSD